MEIKFDIINPGGNITALIDLDSVGLVDASYPRMNKLIMQKYPIVEQVGFYKKDRTSDGWRLDMAGGEFCGNALRSLAYLKLSNLPTKTFFSVSGTNKALEAGIENKGNVFAYLPVSFKVTDIKRIDGDDAYIEMEGIDFVVSPLKEFRAKDMLENKAKSLLANIMAISRSPASGVIFVAKKGSSAYTINPFIYVKEIDTFINETACASGSSAVALALNCPNIGGTTSTKIKQPSDSVLEVEIKRRFNNTTKVKVSGAVSYYMLGEICL